MKNVFEDAVKSGRVKIATRKHHCAFCDTNSLCIQWVPKKLLVVIPICEHCFFALNSARGGIGGAIIWE